MISNITRITSKIIIDADSCPVKDIVLKAAAEYQTEVLLVASISHNIVSTGAGVRVIAVDNVPQAADIMIINNAAAGDIVITGDYGLASLVLSRGAVAISPRGYVFTPKNIDRLLLQRHLDQKIRRGGGRTKGPRALTREDRNCFEKILRQMLGRNSLNPGEYYNEPGSSHDGPDENI